MQGTSYNLLLTEQPFLHQDTDTAHLHTPVPIFFIHSFEQPFCTEENCSCQRQPQEVRQLFIQIVEGKLALEKAADLLDVNEEGK